MPAVSFEASEQQAQGGTDNKSVYGAAIISEEGSSIDAKMTQGDAQAVDQGDRTAGDVSWRTQADEQLTFEESENEIDTNNEVSDDDDDWLYSDDERPSAATVSSKPARTTASEPFLDDSARHLEQDGAGAQERRTAGKPLARYEEMSTRDTSKVINTFQDTGYREGITAGKLSTLQDGFDRGFSEVGVPYGRQLGILKGQLDVLRMACSQLLSALKQHAGEHEHDHSGDGLDHPRDEDGASRRAKSQAHIRLRNGYRAAADAPSLSSSSLLFLPPSFSLRHVGSSQLRDFLGEAERASKWIDEVHSEASNLTLESLAEPDWEALEHELEHANLAGGSDDEGGDRKGMRQVQRETLEQRQAREDILPSLASRSAEMEQSLTDLLARLIGAHGIHARGQQQFVPSRDAGIA